MKIILKRTSDFYSAPSPYSSFENVNSSMDSYGKMHSSMGNNANKFRSPDPFAAFSSQSDPFGGFGQTNNPFAQNDPFMRANTFKTTPTSSFNNSRNETSTAALKSEIDKLFFGISGLTIKKISTAGWGSQDNIEVDVDTFFSSSNLEALEKAIKDKIQQSSNFELVKISFEPGERPTNTQVQTTTKISSISNAELLGQNKTVYNVPQNVKTSVQEPEQESNISNFQS